MNKETKRRPGRPKGDSDKVVIYINIDKDLAEATKNINRSEFINTWLRKWKNKLILKQQS